MFIMARESVKMKVLKWFVVVVVILGMVFFFGTYFIFQGPVDESSFQNQPQDPFSNMEKANFQTEDGVMIVANWWPHEGARRAVLLLHMMPSTKESWNGLAAVLNTAGFAALAIDLRGHGESVDKLDASLPLNYQRFSDQEHQESKRDVAAAINFLRQKGFADENIALIGASIGANLAIDYLSQNSEIKTAVALSAGLDYRGVTTEEAVKDLGPGQSLFLAVSEGDQYAYQSTTILSQLISRKKEVKILKGAEHGTNVFLNQPALAEEIIKWLQEVYG